MTILQAITMKYFSTYALYKPWRQHGYSPKDSLFMVRRQRTEIEKTIADHRAVKPNYFQTH
jgi:hypothetical protein